MGILSGIFKARDKPSNATAGSAYRFLFGGSTSGKAVTERSAMQPNLPQLLYIGFKLIPQIPYKIGV